MSVRLSVTRRYCIEKKLDESSWVLAFFSRPPILHCVICNFKYLRNQGYFPKKLCHKLWTPETLLRQVDSVVDKTHRRSSLLTTLTTIVASELDGQCYALSAHIVYYTFVDRNAPTSVLRFVVDLLYNLLIYFI